MLPLLSGGCLLYIRSDVCIRTFSSVRRADPAVGDGEIEVPGSAIRRRVPVAVDRSSLVAKQTDEPLVEVTSGSLEAPLVRSEERRVGQEGRYRGSQWY